MKMGQTFLVREGKTPYLTLGGIVNVVTHFSRITMQLSTAAACRLRKKG